MGTQCGDAETAESHICTDVEDARAACQEWQADLEEFRLIDAAYQAPAGVRFVDVSEKVGFIVEKKHLDP